MYVIVDAFPEIFVSYVLCIAGSFGDRQMGVGSVSSFFPLSKDNRFVRLLLKHMPTGITHRLMRYNLHCDPDPSGRLRVKLAETREEYEACFRLLHDVNVARGWINPRPSGLYMMVHHALPTTSVVCVSYDGVVVATMSLVRDNPFGFPLQYSFDLDSVRSQGRDIGEVCSMVVAPEFAQERARVLLPLMRYIYEYATRYFDLRFLVIGASPLHIVEYEAVLGFKALPALKRPHVVFENRPMAMAAALELRKVPDWLREQYGHLSIEQNLYAYFVEARFDNLLFPGVRYDGSSVSGMAPELVDEFFNKRTRTFAELEGRDLLRLHQAFKSDELRAVLPPIPDSHELKSKARAEPRFAIRCSARFLPDEHERHSYHACKLIDCAAHSVRVHFRGVMPKHLKGTMFIVLGSELRARIMVSLIRRSPQDRHVAVFQIDTPDRNWNRFIQALHQHADAQAVRG